MPRTDTLTFRDNDTDAEFHQQLLQRGVHCELTFGAHRYHHAPPRTAGRTL